MRTRTIEVLKKFISIDYPLTIDSLSEEFQIGVRTLRYEINEINDFLKSEQFPLILNVRNKGLILKTTVEQKESIRQKFCHIKISPFLNKDQRLFDLILSIAFNQQPLFICHKEKEYFVSKSVLDEDIRKLKLRLKKYDIELVSDTKSGMKFIGLERSIRIMLYELINQFAGNIKFNKLLNEAKPIHQLLYKYIPQSVFVELMMVARSTISQVPDEIYLKQIVIFSAIWYKRNLQFHHLTITHLNSIDNNRNEITDYIKQVTTQFNLNPIIIEKQYITFMLETFNTKDINNSVEWVNAQLFSIKMVNYVEEKTQIPFSTKEERLYESLCKHIAGLLSRIKNNIHFVNPLLDNIKLNYSKIFNVIKCFILDFEHEIGSKISDDEIAFLTIHFSALESSINQERSYYFKAIVFCDHGIATSNLLAETLKEYFNIDILAVLSRNNINLLNQLDFDLIFSTFPIEHKDKPVLVLEPILREKNHQIIFDFLEKHRENQRIATNYPDTTHLFYSIISVIKESGGDVTASIYRKLEKCLENNNLKINKRKIQPMLKDILDDDDIVLHQNCKNWQKAIEIAAKPLLLKKAINQSYIDAMLEAVKKHGPYIVIGKHLALAHARPEDGVNKLALSVSTMQEPVDFGNHDMGPVKIVFCLAAVDSFSHLNIMRSLIDLINDEKKLDLLINCKSIASFKKILFQ